MFTRKLAYAVLLSAAIPAVAGADNVGQCGWGSKLMEGNEGIVPQVLAVTTNGTSGNQTFGITSGTSGCTQDGVVRSSWKTAMFIDGNMNKLARDTAAGQGESLSSLANLLGVTDGDKELFYGEMKSNFSEIFASEATTSQDVRDALRGVLARNEALSKYSAGV